jgi:hypothetical protein
MATKKKATKAATPTPVEEKNKPAEKVKPADLKKVAGLDKNK